MNDVTAWSEHVHEGRQYWFNRINGTSTFDKPLVLKTPEERSIPPCPWKEYSTTEGKKYYSNGTESLWEAPEEFRLWKERMDALNKKPVVAPPPPPSIALASSKSMGGEVSTTEPKRSVSKKHVEVEAEPEIVYGSREEAVAAFTAMLQDSGVTSSMKMKDVQDACEKDRRWNALKGGDKKQCLAEYQTKKLKLEKEAAKAKSKRNRDNFLQLLAEHVEIDARTRWRDAVELLQGDSRFKNLDDPREREDVFDDFVQELEKKDKEDRLRQRDAALVHLDTLLGNLKAAGKVNHRSTWADTKVLVFEAASRDSPIRLLDDLDIKRRFHDYVAKLEDHFHQERRAKRKEAEQRLEQLDSAFRKYLNSLAGSGLIDHNTRWKDIMVSSVIADNDVYLEFSKLAETLNADLGGALPGPRECFLKVQKSLTEWFKSDRSLLVETMREFGLAVEPDAIYDEFRSLLLKLVEVDGGQGKLEGADLKPPTSFSKKDLPAYLRDMLTNRPANLKLLFKQLQEEAAIHRKEEERQRIKRETLFLELLEDNFYRSDHVSVTWDEARELLQDYREYKDLPSEERKSLFAYYMAELNKKQESKANSLKRIGGKQAEPEEGELTDDAAHSEASRERHEKKHKKVS